MPLFKKRLQLKILLIFKPQGNVLTFLDAHVECTEGWLLPLLSCIANDRSVIAVPLIDTISSADMSYQYGETITINGFRWTLIFNS